LLSERLSAAVPIGTKNRIKRLLWSCGVGQLFRALLARPDAFGRYFRRRQRSIMLYTSNLCNALCAFCAYPTNIDPKQSMSNAVAFKIIDEFIAMAGPGSIDFTPNLGDPLVDPNLGDKLAYAKEKGIEHTHFHTNGILLDRPGLIEKIAPHLDRLRISLPGLDRKNYLEVFKVDKAEKVTRGLLKLAEYKKRTGYPKEVYLDFRSSRPLDVVMQDEGMIKIKPYIDEGIFKIGSFYTEYDTYGGTIGDKDLVGLMQIRRGEAKRSVPCFALFTHAGVLPDGHVRACACWYIKTNYDKLTLESVAEKPLAEILYGDGHRAIIQDWMLGDLPPPCPKCTYYQPASFKLGEIVGMAQELLRP
jgi:MoaA/NifB/PqqE/SkfB family radical SAM enzyme